MDCANNTLGRRFAKLRNGCFDGSKRPGGKPQWRPRKNNARTNHVRSASLDRSRPACRGQFAEATFAVEPDFQSWRQRKDLFLRRVRHTARQWRVGHQDLLPDPRFFRELRERRRRIFPEALSHFELYATRSCFPTKLCLVRDKVLCSDYGDCQCYSSPFQLLRF